MLSRNPEGSVVSKELSIPLSTPVASGSATYRWLRSAAIVLAASAFVAVCAHLSLPLPFTPVPLSLQPFAVLLIGLLLSPQLAAASLAAYLLEGAAGLPVFAPGLLGAAGLAHLLGPTGGYLLSYPIAAPVISLLFRSTKRGYWAAFAVAGAGSLIILGSGAMWFSVYTHARLAVVLAQSVVPFLPGDALKVAAAAGVAASAFRLRRNRDDTQPIA